MRKPQFASNEIYHIYNRGTEKRNVFLDEQDHLRFLHDLFEFNDIKPALASNVRLNSRHPSRATDLNKLRSCLEVQPPNRRTVINILAFCLMPNHFHLLIQQKEEKGVVKFMQKLGTGYTMYFNKKYQRVGSLFQGRFKATIIERDAYFLHIPNYIHCNPLKLIMPDWKTSGAPDINQAVNFLENYRWSSFSDYIGKKNFPSLTQRELLLNTYGGPAAYKENIIKCLDSRHLNMEVINIVR